MSVGGLDYIARVSRLSLPCVGRALLDAGVMKVWSFGQVTIRSLFDN